MAQHAAALIIVDHQPIHFERSKSRINYILSHVLHRGIDLDGGTVGIAFVRRMCSDTHSVGVTQDRGRAISSVGVTAAHELGHIFNMGHDDDGSEWYIFIYKLV